MSDLFRLVEEACAWLDGLETTPLSGFPETLSGGENQQASDITGSFRSFRPFQSENTHHGSDDPIGSKAPIFSSDGSRALGFYEKAPERPETPEREGESPAESTSSLFPVEREEPERPETGGDVCGRPFLDLNTAAPQCSDWWTGPAMAEADRLAPPAEPLPIAPADVWAGIERETLALAGLSLSEDETRRRAIEITAAKIRNSEALAERQVHPGRCHICGEALDDSAPVVAVLSWSRGSALHLHSGCHDAYRARRTALVDKIMAAAGFGIDQGER